MFQRALLRPVILAGILALGAPDGASADSLVAQAERIALQNGMTAKQVEQLQLERVQLTTPGLTPEGLLYQATKFAGHPAPTWLSSLFNHPGDRDAPRTGGDNWDDATEIEFEPGATWTDSGTTNGYTDDIPVGPTPPLSCNTSYFEFASFGGPDAFYTFTLPASYEVSVSTCNIATYDTCLGIFNEDQQAVAINEDGAGCSNWTSLLPPCCLPAGTYYLVVDAYSNQSGDYDITVTFGDEPCVVMDPCEEYAENTIQLTAPGTVAGTNFGEPHVYGGIGGDQGIDVVIPSDGLWDFDTCLPGTLYDSAIYLFTESPCDGGELLYSSTWSNCQAPWGAGRLLELPLEAGTYHLLVGDDWTMSGDFELRVQPTPPRPTTGGPDEMGYVWTNSLDEDGPEFAWVDISTTGVDVPLFDDDFGGPFDMGIDFPFYEGTYNQCWIGSNGYVSFTQGYTSLSAMPFPTPSDGWSPDNFIAPFWDDLWPVAPGSVRYLSDPANGRFIVQFTNVPGCCSDTNPRHTFQVILYDTGDHLVQYLDMGEGDLGFFSVGQENTDGTIGLQYRYQFDGGLVGDGVAFYVDALEGDFRPPMITLVEIPSDIETELPGDHAVAATVTDETGLASVTLHYTINGGAESDVDMTPGANNLWSGAIPHQPANSLVTWWIVAVDATDLHNTRTTAAQSFDVVSYQTAPQNLNATDGLQTGTTITWMPPPNIEVWGLFGGNLPASEDEAIARLMAEQGMDKLQAAAVWQRWRQPAEREFEGFRLYRDDEMIAEVEGLSFTDHLNSGSEADVVYTYAVTAMFTAGESERSNEDEGSWATAPSSGGPDAFGYIWRSSLDAGGPDYEWTDISGIGTNLGIMGDDTGAAAGLPFEFPWYGGFFTTAHVSSNGWLAFTQPQWWPYWNGPIPNPEEPNNTIYAMWDDLYVGWNGAAVYQYDDTENERVIFQWDGVHPLGNSTTPHTFQIILSASGIAHVVYEDISETEVLDVTVGTENGDGTDGLQVTWDAQGMPILDECVLAILPPSNCEPVECAGTQETEPNEGWNDNNASYDVIHCGETLCGTVLANGATTDTDWYLYTHFGGNITVELEVSDFNGRVSLREQTLDGATLAQAGSFPRCFDEAFTVNNLPAGTYYVVVEHTGTPDVATPQTYSVSMTCSGDPCSGHEPVVCEGTAEVEPNEGWNSDNATYGLISLGETVCGSTWANAGSRDMDWFRFTLDQPASIILECEQDAFDAALFITDFATSGSVLAEVDESPACWPETLPVANLPAGDYYAVVTHSSFDGVPAPQNYALTLRLAGVVEDPCDNYVDHGDFHDIAHVNRPAPVNFHHDGTGCPGGVSSPGRDEVVRLVLAEAMDLQVTLQGAGNADEVILLLGNCAQPQSSCGAAANAQGAGPGLETLTFPNLPAGDYFVVADFAGVGETAAYQMVLRDMNSGLGDGRQLDFTLEPAYPNPFNPSTTLGWTQPALAEATLVVRDVRGAVVETLDLGVRGAGRHQVVWDATRFGSGVYFCTLAAGEHVSTVKAVLLK